MTQTPPIDSTRLDSTRLVSTRLVSLAAPAAAIRARAPPPPGGRRGGPAARDEPRGPPGDHGRVSYVVRRGGLSSVCHGASSSSSRGRTTTRPERRSRSTRPARSLSLVRAHGRVSWGVCHGVWCPWWCVIAARDRRALVRAHGRRQRRRGHRAGRAAAADAREPRPLELGPVGQQQWQ